MAALAPALQPNQPPGTPPLAGQQPTPPLGEQQQPEAKAPAPWSSAELQQKYEDAEQKIKAIHDESGALQPPKLELAPQPTAKQTNPIEVWGSAAMFLATVGSLMTRTHMTTALNSASKVMDAFKKQDQDEMNAAFETWKVSNENAIKAQNFQIEAYKAALQKAEKDETAAMAEFTAYAKAFGDHTAATLGEQRNKIAAGHLVVDQAKATSTIEKTQLEILEKKTGLNNFLDLDNAHRTLAQATATGDPKAIAAAKDNAMQVTQRVQDWQTTHAKGAGSVAMISDADADYVARQRLTGDPTAYQGLGHADRAKAIAAQTRIANELHITPQKLAANDAHFFAVKSAERTAGTTQARIGLGAAEAQQLIPLVEKASKALPRSHYPTMNAMMQAMQAESGNEQLRDLLTKLRALKSAYAQVVARGGVPGKDEQDKADELFATKDPHTVMLTVTKALRQEIKAVKKAPGMVEQEIESSITGEPVPDDTDDKDDTDDDDSGSADYSYDAQGNPQ